MADAICDICGERGIEESIRTEHFHYGAGSEQVVLQAEVPVLECRSCGEAYTDSRGEELRDAAVRRHIGHASRECALP